MLPDEARRFRRLSSSSEALAFIEAFWRRRDPDPETPGNPFAQKFFERVQSADVLYAEPGRAGSLTDRGRALILLGSPSILRYTQRAAPTWDPGEEGRSRRPPSTERVRLEVWGYTRDDLPPALVARLEKSGEDFPVEVSFVEAGPRSLLVDGEDLLEEAARAAVREEE
jgi:GWxTD domain-containing protein